MSAIPTSVAFERRYSDDSGVEFGVRYDARAGDITFVRITDTSFPVEELDWLLETLHAIRDVRLAALTEEAK